MQVAELDAQSEAVKVLEKKEAWRRRLPLLPALIFTIVVTQVPFILTIYYSLTGWVVNPPRPRELNGFSNYVDIVSDGAFGEAIWVTLQTVSYTHLTLPTTPYV